MTSVISRLTLTAVCLSTMLGASERPTKIDQLYGPSDKYSAYLTDKGIEVNGKPLGQENLSSDLRGKSRSAIASLLSKRRLEITPEGAGYRVNTRETLKGGGPISGAIAYWLTKTICYGSMAGAAVGAVTVTAGAVLPAGAAGIAGGALGGAVGNAIGGVSTVAGSISGGLVSGAVASNAALAGGAAFATAEVATATTAVGGVVIAVESASTAAGAFFTALPFLP